GFKHVGVFPEQASNWEWIMERVEGLAGKAGRVGGKGAAKDSAPKVLNLFGYTGIASIAAARAGAHVTHVDASRQSNEWAKENARLSEVGLETAASTKQDDESAGGGIRYLLDDALKFTEREVRRGSLYDGIILDPPAFGRGPKGEVWKIEEQLPKLLSA